MYNILIVFVFLVGYTQDLRDEYSIVCEIKRREEAAQKFPKVDVSLGLAISEIPGFDPRPDRRPYQAH